MSASATGQLPAQGDLVTVMGQDGIGEVLEISSERAKVRLVHRASGKSTTAYFPLKALVVLRSTAGKSPIRIYSYGELAVLPPTPPLIEDVIRHGDFGMLYGLPSAGKTFVALDMGLCVASGLDWHGRHVVHGAVLYIAGEGVRGLHKRVRAWLLDQPDDVRALVEKHFQVNPGAVNFLGDEFEHLLAAIRALDPKPVLVVVDTLARCSAGGDENSAQDMGRFVDACSAITKLTGATVLVLHHTNKLGESERGSSALRGAADAMFHVTVDERDGEKLIRVAGDKAKDDEELAPLTFSLDVVEVGVEANGAPETSCRLTATTSVGEEATFHSLHPASLQILRTLRDSSFDDGMPSGSLESACGLSRPTYFRHLKIVVDAGYADRKRSGNSVRYTLTPKFTEPRVSPVSPSPETSQRHHGQSHVSQVSHPLRGETVRHETPDLEFASAERGGFCDA